MPWIFGYGSLVFRPGFAFVEARDVFVRDHARRFWQGSTDHRGVPGAPGRVVTLIPAPGAITWGRAYRVDAGPALDAVIAQLDHREQGGYVRLDLTVFGRDERALAERAITYVATPENPEWLGDAPLDEIAAQIRRSRGPSGANVDYVLALARALAELGGPDPYVDALALRLGSDALP